MSQEYQASDQEIVDYQLFELEQFHLRGPKPSLLPGQYFVCIGSAHTFGRYVQNPFPNLLSQKLGLDCLNLGVGGAGPLMFKQPALKPIINHAKFAVVQIMSGRSMSNSAFKSRGGVGLEVQIPDLQFESADSKATLLTRISANQQFLQDTAGDQLTIPVGFRLHATEAYKALLRSKDDSYCQAIRQETKLRYVLSTIALLREIQVPKILFYFSNRRPAAMLKKFKYIRQFLGEFPHFVDQEVINELQPYADHYAECVTERGFPHQLPKELVVSSPIGKPRVIEQDNYYPSPEMHEDAALELLKVTQSFI